MHKSIDAHIVELQNEIAALEAALAALQGDSAGVGKPVAANQRSAPTRRHRRIAQAGSNGNAASAAPVPATNDGAPNARNRLRAKQVRTKPVEVLLAGKLEAMLSESEDGLSAITISKRANAGYNQVLGLLRELEASGQVRRSGTRRTSLWRVVTDEERIAERAAELEALRAVKVPTLSGA